MMNLFYIFLVGTVFYISTASCQESNELFRANCQSLGLNIPSDYIIKEEFGSAYKYYPIRKNWNTARKRCVEDGAHLAIIDSKEELEYLASLKKKPRIEAWIGYHNLFTKKTITRKMSWTSVLDETVDLGPYWGGGQPDYNHERCVAIWRGAALNNLGCERSEVDGVPNHFICEIHC